MAVLGLGLLSALALLGASLADFGDPRATARAQAQQAVRAQVAEVRLAWDEVRASEALLPGSAGLLKLGERASGGLPERGPTVGEPTGEPGPLARAYFELGREALQRGDAPSALESFSGGLAESGTETEGYRAALFGALRAAGALGQGDRVHELRSALYGQPDDVVDGTSLHLLAALVPPVDAEGAHGRLMSETALLRPPLDRVAIGHGEYELAPDPWWSAVRARLSEGDRADGLDWDAAFRTQVRLRLAMQRELDGAGVSPTDRWTISSVGGGWLAVRQRGPGTEVASVRLDGLEQGLLGSGENALLRCKIERADTSSDDAMPLSGSPFSLSVSHSDPEGSATLELRRIRILRTALVGLGLLVLLATVLSARAMARARQLNELRSTFVASVSHDLRTPTQAILLLAQTLEQDLVEAPEGRARYHTQIRKEAQRLRRLVEDLLDGARIDRGDGARIERRDVESAGFFDELRTNMEERAAGAGAQLRVDIAEMPDFLYVDPDGLYRAVWNLLENALRYGRYGDAPADVRVTARAEGEGLQITVEDQGPGIPSRYAESIFRPFQRLGDRALKSDMQSDTGTGLGLPIVRAICRAHGGSVVLEPGGDGARFTLTLPIVAPEGAIP